jgi:hypothetical protein
VSDEAIHTCLASIWIASRSLSSGGAEPVIGRAFARPVGADPLARNDRKTYPFVIPGHAKREPGISRAPE